VHFPKAIVVLKPGASATREELASFARERLAGFKTPGVIEFVAELPKTAQARFSRPNCGRIFLSGQR
jgi:acyl-coenzyme A synthetase/AMP-(fatty) acid ligase